MAPSLVLPSGMSTRSRTSVGGLSLRSSNIPSNPKRKQENSPPKGSKGLLKKRPALGELTNAAALKTAALKKGSNLDLGNLKPVAKTTINIHQDVIKPKTKPVVNSRTTTTKPSNVFTTSKQAPVKTTSRPKTTSSTLAVRPNVPANVPVTKQTSRISLLVSKPGSKHVTVTQTRKLAQPKSTISTKSNQESSHVKNKPSAAEAIKTHEPTINIRRESLRSHRRSSGIKSDESSLYVSALEEFECWVSLEEIDFTSLGDLTVSNKNKKSDSQESRKSSKSKQTVATISERNENSLIVHFKKEIKLEEKAELEKTAAPPSTVDDFDKETWDDPLQVSCYAMHIFEYLKSREAKFKIRDYIPFQSSSERGRINPEMRAVLVDWMVEIQETFELNHETLYLSIKLVDLYLSKTLCSRENLQLLGATALFVSSKFDDRIPPQLSDLEYICSHTYSIQDLKDMEIKLVSSIGFDLGIPLSYRFLRRYARCNRIQLPLLTLARYILELSLMEYSLTSESDSKLASAALYLALRMSSLPPWNETLEYYSGYKVACFKHLVIELNRLLQCQPRTVMMQTLSTVYNKYSHPIFFEVAKTPLVKEADLFS